MYVGLRLWVFLCSCVSVYVFWCFCVLKGGGCVGSLFVCGGIVWLRARGFVCLRVLGFVCLCVSVSMGLCACCVCACVHKLCIFVFVP